MRPASGVHILDVLRVVFCLVGVDFALEFRQVLFVLEGQEDLRIREKRGGYLHDNRENDPDHDPPFDGFFEILDLIVVLFDPVLKN
jgi:hypothetical protein